MHFVQQRNLIIRPLGRNISKGCGCNSKLSKQHQTNNGQTHLGQCHLELDEVFSKFKSGANVALF